MATEDTLFKTIGGFGRYQKLQFVILCLNSFFGVELLYCNFLAYTPNHWCKVEPMNGWANLSTAELKNLTIPWDEKAGEYSSCEMYEHNITDDVIKVPRNASVTSCRSWDFDDSVFSNTVVTKWHLVCDKAWLAEMFPFCHVFGYLVGSLIAGIVSDRFGRWKGTVIFLAVKATGNLMSMFAPNYPVVLASRFILGAGGVAAYIITFVLALETTSPGHRTWMGVVLSLMFSFGSMFLAGVAYIERDWRRLQLACTVPSVLMLIIIFFFVYESPRWLLQRGQKEEGLKILRRIGDINRSPFLEKVNTSELQKKDSVAINSSSSLLKLFVTPSIRKYTLICLFTWCSVSLIFYALSLNARALSGNIFLNFFRLSAIEVPANLAVIVCLRSKILARRRTHVLAFLLAGLSCLISVPLIVVYGKSNITTGLAIVGKAGATAAFTAIYIYTAELFPTEIRTLAIGVSSLAGRVGSLLAPYAGGSLGKVWAPLPSVIFGVAGTVSGLLILLLPETRGKVLKDTVEEEEIGDNEKPTKV